MLVREIKLGDKTESKYSVVAKMGTIQCVKKQRIQLCLPFVLLLYLTNVCVNASTPPHVLFVSNGVQDHILPLVHMAKQLEKQYRISIATQQFAKHIVLSNDLPFIPGGDGRPSVDLWKSMCYDSSFFRGMMLALEMYYKPSVDSMVQEILLHMDTPPDFIVLDNGTPAGYVLATYWNIPYIVNSPSLMYDHHMYPGTGYSPQHNTIYKRILRRITPRMMYLTASLLVDILPSETIYPEDIPILANTLYGIEYPTVCRKPNVYFTGPMLSPKVYQAMPPIIHEWLSTSMNNTILVDFGPNIYLQTWQIDTLVTSFQSLPYQILWFTHVENEFPLPSTIRTVHRDGFPIAEAILGHPKLTIMVSPCSSLLSSPALVHHVYLLCIPFYMDQIDISIRIADAGNGAVLDKSSFTSSQVIFALQTKDFNPKLAQLLSQTNGTFIAAKIISQYISGKSTLLPHSTVYDVGLLFTILVAFALSLVHLVFAILTKV